MPSNLGVIGLMSMPDSSWRELHTSCRTERKLEEES
jgi:hypothetical protein